MDKPTCPGELRNPILIIDLTKNAQLSEQRNESDPNAFRPGTSSAGASNTGPDVIPCSESSECLSLALSDSSTSLHRGLNLAAQYLRKSIKPSTQDQVGAL